MIHVGVYKSVFSCKDCTTITQVSDHTKELSWMVFPGIPTCISRLRQPWGGFLFKYLPSINRSHMNHAWAPLLHTTSFTSLSRFCGSSTLKKCISILFPFVLNNILLYGMQCVSLILEPQIVLHLEIFWVMFH